MNCELYSNSVDSYQTKHRYSRLQKSIAKFTIFTSLMTLASCYRESESDQSINETNNPTATSSQTISQAPISPTSIQIKPPGYDLQVYYGEECQEVASQTSANLISMDYSNVASNIYTGDDNLSLKDGLIRRVRQAVTSGNKDYLVELTDEQQDVIAASVDGLVEQTYGNDILPNDQLYYVNVASFYDQDSKQPSSRIDTNKSQDSMPIYVVPDLNYCVFDLTEAQNQ